MEISTQQAKLDFVKATEEFKNYKMAENQLYDKLASMVVDSFIHDGVKIKCIYLLAEMGCDQCYNFLFDHLVDQFFEGGGDGSEESQKSPLACFSALSSKFRDKSRKWDIVPLAFHVLSTKPLNEDYLFEFRGIFLGVFMSNKVLLISYLEAELSQMTYEPPSILKDNLQALLAFIKKYP